jgi:ribosomal protein S18 acetylase RimI-like enzyme
VIRAAARSDLSWLVGALGRLNAAGTEADPRYVPRADTPLLLRAQIDEVWFGRFHRFPPCLVADEGGGLVGLVAGGGRPPHPILDEPPTAVISDLWVEPSHRRRGLARELVSAFRDHARAAGCTRLEVTTLARDTRAVAFWRALGFSDLRIVLEWDASR